MIILLSEGVSEVRTHGAETKVDKRETTMPKGFESDLLVISVFGMHILVL